MSHRSRKDCEPSLLQVGEVLDGRFEVDSFIGAGSFSEVYRGRQLSLDRPVAIKVLHLGGSKRQADMFRERFIREAKVASRIQHPSAVTIYEYGVSDEGRPYIVQELLDGLTLDRVLEDHGPLSMPRAVLLTIRCLEALEDAHALDIVHRDIKPANLFVARYGRRSERMSILDFGMAFTMEAEHARLTRTGQINGTPRYISPEYLTDALLSPALDVYQFGLTFVEMMTGEPVVNDETSYECFMRHTTGNLKIPGFVLRSPLGPVVGRAVALDPRDRFPDAGAFREDLERVLPKLRQDLDDGQSAELEILQLHHAAHRSLVEAPAKNPAPFVPHEEETLVFRPASKDRTDPRSPPWSPDASIEEVFGPLDSPLSDTDHTNPKMPTLDAAELIDISTDTMPGVDGHRLRPRGPSDTVEGLSGPHSRDKS